MVNRFMEQRQKRNISIEDLSVKTGICADELNEIESAGDDINEVSAVKAAKIAIALECMLSDLIYVK